MANLIFCDIDGTIIDGIRGMYNVSFKTRYAIQQLKKNGDYVIIASGRNKGLLNDEIKSLEPGGYVLCNGAYAEIDGKPIFEKAFSSTAVEKIAEVPVKNHGFYILESVDDVHVHSFQDESFRFFMRNWGLDHHGFAENEELRDDFYIAMIGFLDEDDARKATDELNGYVDIARHKSFISYDINVKGINKGTGVRKIIEYLDVPFENTYCFGDSINDLEMLQSVFHPVIVENAHELLKGFGFEMTDDVVDDGFYNYLVSNKLIKAL